VFGIGPQELMILGLLVLVVFGPLKASSMARDLGHFVKETRRPVEEFKAEIAAAGEDLCEPVSDLDSVQRLGPSAQADDRAQATCEGGHQDRGVPPE
jgi:Sec-independent protein translocase protein TatA